MNITLTHLEKKRIAEIFLQFDLYTRVYAPPYKAENVIRKRNAHFGGEGDRKIPNYAERWDNGVGSRCRRISRAAHNSVTH